MTACDFLNIQFWFLPFYASINIVKCVCVCVVRIMFRCCCRCRCRFNLELLCSDIYKKWWNGKFFLRISISVGLLFISLAPKYDSWRHRFVLVLAVVMKTRDFMDWFIEQFSLLITAFCTASRLHFYQIIFIIVVPNAVCFSFIWNKTNTNVLL